MSKGDNVSLQKMINRIPLLNYQYFDSFPSDHGPFFLNENFVIISTQPSNT